MNDAAARNRTGFLLLVSITLFWGINWPAMKLSVNEVPVWAFRTICLLVGGIGLLAICRAFGYSLYVPREERRPLLISALGNITGWHIFSALGVHHMAPGRASILAFTMPLWAAVIAAIWTRERLTGLTVAALAIGAAGLAVLVVPDWANIVSRPAGPIFMILAAISWASGTVALKRYRFTIPTAALAGWQMLLGGIPIFVGAALFDRGFDPGSVSTTAWIAVAYAAVIPMIYCHWAWFRVVSLYPASIAAIGTLAIPVVGVISSAWFIGERIGWSEIAALALVLAALTLVLVVPALKNRAEAVPEPE
ncbi:DMT family transporter [Dongia sp.]|uniref:DMT family transporter n=1 Tax=Dongia sp. TaxID=1977262 RepID=UPI0037517431